MKKYAGTLVMTLVFDDIYIKIGLRVLQILVTIKNQISKIKFKK